MRALQILIVVVFLFPSKVWSQAEYVSTDTNSFTLTSKECAAFTKRAAQKCTRLTQKIKKTTDKSLAKYVGLEDKLLQRICAFDERHAESLMRNSLYGFRRLDGQIQRTSGDDLNHHVSELDSLEIVTSYLEKEEGITNELNNEKSKDCQCSGKNDLKKAQADLKKELKRAETVREYIRERNVYLHKLGVEYPELNALLPSIEKLDFYLGAQTKEYLSLFADRSRPEKLLFSALSKVTGFSDFANQLGARETIASAAMQSGGQTMSEAMAQFEAAASANGLDPQSLLNPAQVIKGKTTDLKDQIKNGKGELANSGEELNDALNGGSATVDSLKTSMKKEVEEGKKEWKRNPLKSKRFVDRIVYNFNLQASPRTTLFPTAGIFSSQAAYQLTTKMNIGLGCSYVLSFHKPTIGLEGNRTAMLQSGGYNLRSYFDWNFHRRIFFQTNYELNYRTPTRSVEFVNPFQSPSLRPSVLAGLKLKTPTSKRTQKTVEILYDFMHDQNGQPALVVRMGMDLMPSHGLRK
jgi:hypothetical protein